MHSEEGEFWIRDWINQIAHQKFSALAKFVIFTAERNDAHLPGLAGFLQDAIAMKPGAVNEEVCLESFFRSLQSPNPNRKLAAA